MADVKDIFIIPGKDFWFGVANDEAEKYRQSVRSALRQLNLLDNLNVDQAVDELVRLKYDVSIDSHLREPISAEDERKHIDAPIRRIIREQFSDPFQCGGGLNTTDQEELAFDKIKKCLFPRPKVMSLAGNSSK